MEERTSESILSLQRELTNGPLWRLSIEEGCLMYSEEHRTLGQSGKDLRGHISQTDTHMHLLKCSFFFNMSRIKAGTMDF
jgi:hypothetical protein